MNCQQCNVYLCQACHSKSKVGAKYAEVRQCPAGHKLRPTQAASGNCWRCAKQMRPGERAVECCGQQCRWLSCQMCIHFCAQMPLRDEVSHLGHWGTTNDLLGGIRDKVGAFEKYIASKASQELEDLQDVARELQ